MHCRDYEFSCIKHAKRETNTDNSDLAEKLVREPDKV